MKQQKYIDRILKIFFSRTGRQISLKFGTKYSWVKWIQFCSYEEFTLNSHKVNNVSSLNQCYDINICVY